MKTLLIILAIYVALDITLDTILFIRLIRRGKGLKRLAYYLRESMWNYISNTED